MVRFSVTMSKQLYQAILAYIERRGDSPSIAQVVREALVAYIKDSGAS